MYLSFYHLKHKPFQISTDPRFLWLGEKHEEALATLRYGVLDNKGFLLLTGDVGTGKTTLLNALIKTLDENTYVAFLRDPGLEQLDFFQYIAYAFGMKPDSINSKGSFLIQFEQFLLDAYQKKRKVLLIIDEAQRISQELLEEVRLLSNIEREESKLLNIFFVGQIEFNDIIHHPENRAIRQRITINYNIEALSEIETRQYIKHRLDVASSKEDLGFFVPVQKKADGEYVRQGLRLPLPEVREEIFTIDAIKEVHAFSKGYPRLINIICDRALLTGFVEESKSVTIKHIKECVKELEIPHNTEKIASRQKSVTSLKNSLEELNREFEERRRLEVLKEQKKEDTPRDLIKRLENTNDNTRKDLTSGFNSSKMDDFQDHHKEELLVSDNVESDSAELEKSIENTTVIETQEEDESYTQLKVMEEEEPTEIVPLADEPITQENDTNNKFPFPESEVDNGPLVQPNVTKDEPITEEIDTAEEPSRQIQDRDDASSKTSPKLGGSQYGKSSDFSVNLDDYGKAKELLDELTRLAKSSNPTRDVQISSDEENRLSPVNSEKVNKNNSKKLVVVGLLFLIIAFTYTFLISPDTLNKDQERFKELQEQIALQNSQKTDGTNPSESTDKAPSRGNNSTEIEAKSAKQDATETDKLKTTDSAETKNASQSERDAKATNVAENTPPSPSKEPGMTSEESQTLISMSDDAKKFTSAMEKPDIASTKQVTKEIEQLRALITFERLVIPFPPNSSLPQSESLETLNDLVESLITHPSFDVTLLYFAKIQNNTSKIDKLSEFRANAVKSYLMGRGLDNSRITVKSYKGKELPEKDKVASAAKNTDSWIAIDINR